jgi:hypothetical protein
MIPAAFSFSRTPVALDGACTRLSSRSSRRIRKGRFTFPYLGRIILPAAPHIMRPEFSR